MKAIFFNGSPRKNWNTGQLIESAANGAKNFGAETEIINLYDFSFKGCTSCFACKLKNSKTNGICAMRDEIFPILQKANAADVIVIGSPIYFDYPTAQTRAFFERLLFPLSAYKFDKKTGQPGTTILEKIIPTAMIFTMNTPENWLEKRNYPTILGISEIYLKNVFGYSETLYSCDTLQFKNYSRYDIETFSEEEKIKHREEQFPKDLQKAYELGERLIKLAEKFQS